MVNFSPGWKVNFLLEIPLFSPGICYFLPDFRFISETPIQPRLIWQISQANSCSAQADIFQENVHLLSQDCQDDRFSREISIYPVWIKYFAWKPHFSRAGIFFFFVGILIKCPCWQNMTFKMSPNPDRFRFYQKNKGIAIFIIFFVTLNLFAFHPSLANPVKG